MLWTILFPVWVECFRVLHGSHLHAPLPGVSQLLLLVSSGLGTLVLSWWPLTTVDNVLILSSGVGVYRFPEHNLKQQISIIRVEWVSCYQILCYVPIGLQKYQIS